MNSKINLSKLSIALVGVMVATGTATAGISGSKHDLSVGGGGQGAGAATAICVFCHTPHGANTGAAAPLWNKVLDATGFTRYSDLGTATLDGAEAPVGSVSLACLSCHDGSQAMDVVINAAGSGGYNSNGAEMSASVGGKMTGTPLPNLGKDLRNDHPVSIQYAGGACQGATSECDPSLAATSGDPDFNIARYASINSNPYWWVENTGNGTDNGTRDKDDMILYTRNDFAGAGGTSGPSVECASCHDPHNDATSGAGSVAFLRISNSGSTVCLACHNK